MNLNIGPEYYITSNTSAVLIDSRNIINGSTAVVYLSSITDPGRTISIRDTTGYLDSTTYITLSTTRNVFFPNQESIFSFRTPYGFANCTNPTSTTWQLTNVYAHSLNPTVVTHFSTYTLQASTVKSEYIQSRSITVQNFTTVSDPSNNFIVDSGGTSQVLTNVNFSTLNGRGFSVDISNAPVSTLTFADSRPPYKIGGNYVLNMGYVDISSVEFIGPDSFPFVSRRYIGCNAQVGHLDVKVTEHGGMSNFEVRSFRSDGTLLTQDVEGISWLVLNGKSFL